MVPCWRELEEFGLSLMEQDELCPMLSATIALGFDSISLERHWPQPLALMEALDGVTTSLTKGLGQEAGNEQGCRNRSCSGQSSWQQSAHSRETGETRPRCPGWLHGHCGASAAPGAGGNGAARAVAGWAEEPVRGL